PARGPARSTSSMVSGAPARVATAARVFMGAPVARVGRVGYRSAAAPRQVWRSTLVEDAMETVEQHACGGGQQLVMEHDAASIGRRMRFGAFVPQAPRGVLVFLSGL